MSLLNYNNFITEKYNFKSHNLDFLKYGNWNNKKLPLTDLELSEDKNLSIKSIELYDEIFGTKLKEIYGEDYSLLVKDPSINHVTYGDIIKKLIELSYQPNWYSKFNIQLESSNNINQILLDQIVKNFQGKELEWKHLSNFLSREMKKSQRKQEFLYNLFKKYGSHLNQDIFKKTFEIKNKKFNYEIENIENIEPMSEILEKAFWLSLKWALNHYKDYFNLSDLIEKTGNKMIILLSNNKFSLIDDWINKKIESYLERIK